MNSFISYFLPLILIVGRIQLLLASCQDPVTCYLETVVIAIPDFCQDVNGKDLCISSFACKGINIEGLPSSYISPTTLEAGITGVGTSCAGDYSYGRLVSGTMTASITDTDLLVDLFVGKSGEFPISTEFSSCNITSMNVDITFTSGGLDDLAPALEAVIKKAVDALVCVKIADFVSVNVTNAIVNTIDPKLETIIASQPTPLPQYDSTHYMSWSDSIISKIHKLVDMMDGLSTGGEFLQCLVNDAPTLIHDLLERETRKLLTQAEDKHRIAVDLRDRNIVVSVPSLVSALLAKSAPNNIASSVLSAAPAMNSSVQITGVALYGFDTMNSFALLDPMAESNVSLHTQIGFDSLAIEINLEFTVQSTNDAGEPIVYMEELQAAFRTHDAYVVADMVVAVNEFLLKSYFMDQLSTVNCWLAALTEFSIANLQLHLDIDELSITQISGSAGPFEHDVIALIDNAFKLVTSGFGPLVTDTINGVMQGPVRSGINTKVADALSSAHTDLPCLSHYPYYDTTDYIKWSQSSLITTLDKIVNDQVGCAGINKIMNCATNYTGVLALNTSHLHIQVAGLNSFYALKVLAPADNADYDLTNELGMGYCAPGSSGTTSADCNPLRVIIGSYEDIEEENTVFAMTVNEIARQFKIVLSMENLDVFLDLLLKIDKNGVRDLTFGQTNTAGCTQSTMQSMAIEALSITLSRAQLSVNDGATERNITTIVSKILDTITRAEKVAARNANMEYQLSVADETCRMGGVAPDSTDTGDVTEKVQGDSNEWKWELLVLSLACITCLVCLLWAYQYWGQARQLNCMINQEEDGQQREVVPADGRTFWERWDCSNALVFHSKVPTWLQIAIPVVIIGNMGMFLNSNLLPDAVSVMTEIDIGTEVSITPDSVFDFGLASTVGDMWEAKVYPLSILIAFFSGAWPYIKLASMLAAWVTPPGLMTVERREYILTWLDVLGKWSLIDFFVMVLMLCAFYFNLYIGNNMVVKVTVLPKWGFYGFLLATMISLGLGHIILACHRLVTEHKVLPLPEAYSPKESLASMTYTVYLEPEDKSNKRNTTANNNNANNNENNAQNTENTLQAPLMPAGDSSSHSATESDGAKPREAIFVRLTNAGTCAVVLMICVTAFFVLAGTFLDTMTFEFKGMVGWMLHDMAEVDYSFVSVGTSLPEHSGIPNDFAIRWLQGSFFLFGMAMPLALCVALTILWVVPLSISMQRQLFVLAEVLNAWSTLDVYSVSIIAALLEIQQFAMFIVGDSCDGINKLLENFDEALEGDDKCFDVVAVLKNSCWTIFLAAVLLILVGLPSLSICHKAIHKRMEQTEQGLFDHIQRRHSLTDTLKDAEATASNRAASRDGTQNELTRPLLLVDVPLHDSSVPPAAVSDSVGPAEQNAVAQSPTPPAPKKSLWSQLTVHNFNILLLRSFAAMRLVTIDTVDHSLVARQMFEAKVQQSHWGEGDANKDSAAAMKDGKQDKEDAPATPQHNISYSDIYGDVTPNKTGTNDMSVHVTPF